MTPEEKMELQEAADAQTWAYTVAFVKTAIKAVVMGILFIWLPVAILCVAFLVTIGWAIATFL